MVAQAICSTATYGKHYKIGATMGIPAFSIKALTGNGGGGGRVDSGYSRIRKLADYLYEIWFDRLDEEYAKQFFEGKEPKLLDPSIQLHRGTPGCSAIIKNNIHGRNFDWLFNKGAGFVCHTPEKDGRYATIGVGGQITQLTEEFVASGVKSELYKVVPYMIADGMNSQGVTISTLVVPNENGDNRHVLPNGEVKENICTLQLPRYVLDNFATAQEAISYLTESVELYHPLEILSMGYNQHFVVGDKNGTYLIEFKEGAYVANMMKFPYATNFFLDGIQLNKDNTVLTPESKQEGQEPSEVNLLGTFSSGLERYNEMALAFEGLKDKADIEALMLSLKYTKAYNTAPVVSDPYWYTEFVGSNDLTVDSDVEDFADVVSAAGTAFSNRSRDPQSEYYGT